jgi:hypothetical protein
MTITRYNFEAGVNGANVATGGGIVAVSGVPPTYATAAAFSGSMGVDALGSQWMEFAAPTSTDWSGSLYLRPKVNAGTSSQRVVLFRTATPGNAGGISFNSSGKIRIVDLANVLVGAESTTTWAVNDNFRLDWQCDDTGVDVVITLRIFKNANIGGTTPDETLVRTMPAVDIAKFRVGGSTSGTWDFYYDDLAFSDVLEWIGPTVGDLAAADSAHAHAAESPALTQVHSLGPVDSAHEHTAESLGLTQVHELAPADSVHAHAVESPTLTQVHEVAPVDSSHSHSAESPALTQVHELAPDDTANEHASASPAVAVEHNLAPADSGHAHASGSPVVTQVHLLAPADCVHAHGATSPALTQLHLLAPLDSLHAHASESPATVLGDLAPPAERTSVAALDPRISVASPESRVSTATASSRISSN